MTNLNHRVTIPPRPLIRLQVGEAGRGRLQEELLRQGARGAPAPQGGRRVLRQVQVATPLLKVLRGTQVK